MKIKKKCPICKKKADREGFHMADGSAHWTRCSNCGFDVKRDFLIINKNMEKFTKDLKKEIEEIIEELILNLKPEIKKKIVFRFSDDILKEELEDGKEAITRANITHGLKPAVITIYISAIALSLMDYLHKDLIDIINHELTHLFLRGENETETQSKKMNFFKE